VVNTGVATKKIIKRGENGNFLAFESVTKKDYITVSKQRKLIEKKLSSLGMYKKVSSENVVRIKYSLSLSSLSSMKTSGKCARHRRI
jgi:hypothetical protein